VISSTSQRGFVFFNRLNFLNDLNGLNFFKSWTHMPYFDFSELGALCVFAGDTSSEFFSHQDAKLAKAHSAPSTFFEAPTSISPNLANFAPLREAYSFILSYFSRQVGKPTNGWESSRPLTDRVIPLFIKASPKLSKNPSFSPVSRRYV
jgi:hypothetical protein